MGIRNCKVIEMENISPILLGLNQKKEPSTTDLKQEIRKKNFFIGFSKAN